MKFPTPISIRALVWSAGLGVAVFGSSAHAADWQGLVGNSPFGQTPQNTPPPAAAQIEFRGVVQEDDIVLVNVFNVSTQKSQWIPLQGEANGIAAQRYDSTGEKLEITMGGKAMTLPLKQSRVVLAQAAPVPAPAGPGAPTQGAGGAAGGAAPANAAQGGADAQQALRNLPPEARSMIDEIRRRRALRSQQQQQAAGATNAAQPVRTN
jgi:hypothetical protein